MNDAYKKSIMEMRRGGFLEQVDYGASKIFDNILDPNTRATAKRKMIVTIEFHPDDSRQNIATKFSTKLDLAPTIPLTTSLYIAGENSDGEVHVVEYVPQIPGQIGMGGEEQSAPPVLRLIKIS